MLNLIAFVNKNLKRKYLHQLNLNMPNKKVTYQLCLKVQISVLIMNKGSGMYAQGCGCMRMLRGVVMCVMCGCVFTMMR
jgi:hypothetical protein